MDPHNSAAFGCRASALWVPIIHPCCSELWMRFPARTGSWLGQAGVVAGKPLWVEHQARGAAADAVRLGEGEPLVGGADGEVLCRLGGHDGGRRDPWDRAGAALGHEGQAVQAEILDGPAVSLPGGQVHARSRPRQPDLAQKRHCEVELGPVSPAPANTHTSPMSRIPAAHGEAAADAEAGTATGHRHAPASAG
jgi:hypothetical protein